jgi:hypothetical protein
VDVVVDHVVAVLEVLAFGNAVRSDEDVDLGVEILFNLVSLLRDWRKRSQHRTKVCSYTLQICSVPTRAAGHDGAM